MAKANRKVISESWGPKSSLAPARSALKAFETRWSVVLPHRLKEMLLKYLSAITFKEGAKFVPSVEMPLQSEDGSLPLELLFGPDNSDDGLESRNQTYAQQLPPDMIAIGQCWPGDLMCIRRSDG